MHGTRQSALNVPYERLQSPCAGVVPRDAWFFILPTRIPLPSEIGFAAGVPIFFTSRKGRFVSSAFVGISS